MDKEKIRQWIQEIESRANEIETYCDLVRIELATDEPPESEVIVVPSNGDLQFYLDAGGNLRLEDQAQYTNAAGYSFRVHNTTLTGGVNNLIESAQGTAIDVPLGYENGTLEGIQLKTTAQEYVTRVGRNDSSATNVDVVPHGFTFRKVLIGNHRGKRAFEIHGAEVLIEECYVYGVYDPEKSDSQAIWFGNCPGPAHVNGGHYEAAAENLMIGGDRMKYVNVRPTGFLIENAEFTKPIEWKGNTAIPTKNLLELKDGHDVVIRKCRFWNSWRSAQDGYCFVFTPTQGGSVRNVLINDCDVSEVGAICNIGGVEQHGNYPDLPRTQVHFRGGTYRTNKAVMGGRGCFALIMHGPESVIVEDADIRVDGTAFILVGDSAVVDQLHILNCKWNYPQYGIMIGGRSHGDNSLGIVKDLRIEGNTITGANSTFKSRYPNNTYL